MKRLFAIIILVVAISTNFMLGDSLGVKGGISAILVSQESVTHYPETSIGMRAAVFYLFRISGKISLSPEVAFTMKGFDYYNMSNRMDDHVNFNFIEIPILANFNLSKVIDFFIGPYFGFLLNSIDIDDINTGSRWGKNGPWTWESSEMNKFDFGISLGLRLNVSKTLFFEVMFNKGINKFIYNDTFTENHPYTNPHRNNIVTFQVGIIL